METLKHALGAHLQRPGRRWCVLMCYGAAKAAPISSPLPYQLGLALPLRTFAYLRCRVSDCSPPDARLGRPWRDTTACRRIRRRRRRSFAADPVRSVRSLRAAALPR